MYFSISYEMQFFKNVVILLLSAWQNFRSEMQQFFKSLLKPGVRQHMANLSGICNLCKPNKSVVPYTTNRYFISFSETSYKTGSYFTD